MPMAASMEKTELDGLDVQLWWGRVEVSLHPLADDPSSRRMRSLWHHVRPQPGARIVIQSHDDAPRRVRLSARSDAPDFPRWVRWSSVARSVSDLGGGEAIGDMDEPAEGEGGALSLLVLPHERREALLGFEARLDGGTVPGDYPFQVVIADTHKEREARLGGSLRLRHPTARLLEQLPALYRDALYEDGVAVGVSAQASGASLRPSRNGSKPYQEPPFFERYLRGFEDVATPLQETLANLHLCFGPSTAPPDFLPWLARWVALTLGGNWPELKRRALIREALTLYRWRGTRRGLERFLEIYTGVRPDIRDQPSAGMRLGDKTLLGHAKTVLGDVGAHAFTVTLAVADPDAVNEQIVRDIIAAEKPAHTVYALRIVRRRASGEDR